VTYYHQDFKNYFYSAPLIQVAQRVSIPTGGSTTGPNPGDVYAFNTLQIIAVNVPAKVDGVEGEIGFQATPDWNMSATLSYSDSKIKNGQVPCNLPAATPFYGVNGAAFVAANGGQQYGTCTANFRAGNSAPFSGSFQTEYSHELTDRFTGFIRGLVTYYGHSQNDPTNPIDDIKAYGLVNLFLGLRDPNGMWELTGYAKNIFDTQRVLTRDANPSATSYQVLQPPTFRSAVGGAGITSYRTITMTAPREFGLNLRVSFGSR
jgi:iron complex outermembrane receptor protein